MCGVLFKLMMLIAIFDISSCEVMRKYAYVTNFYIYTIINYQSPIFFIVAIRMASILLDVNIH